MLGLTEPNMDPLKEKEIRILGYLAKNSTLSQRELAEETGLSLGHINMILKKFLRIGYIQVTHLNKRKMQYFLTSQGRQEATRKSYLETTDTLKKYKKIYHDLCGLLQRLAAKGYDYFSIHGDGELRELIESTFQTNLGNIATLGTEHRDHPQAVVLSASTHKVRFDEGFQSYVVDVLGEITS